MSSVVSFVHCTRAKNSFKIDKQSNSVLCCVISYCARRFLFRQKIQKKLKMIGGEPGLADSRVFLSTFSPELSKGF